MHYFFSLPFELRAVLLFLVGTVVGTQLNWAIYRLAFHRREIGPWAPRDKRAPPRAWSDWLPVFGWLGLARESKVHGSAFWVRPLLIELATGLGFAALYAWETIGGQLVPISLGPIAALPNGPEQVHWECLSHLILISLMIVATFIDFDEQTIPDEITVPGAVAGLALAAAVPFSLLPATKMDMGVPMLDHLLISSPTPWPDWLDEPWGLVCGLACFWGWCLAIVPSLWTTRRGLIKAFVYQLVSMIRVAGLWRYVALAATGGAAIAAVWWLGGEHWHALLTSLVGMVFAGSLVWGVRIIGSAALGKEAMGFGDVTLMAMIGAFLGWQPSLLVFFLAPFAALFIAISQWLITRRHDIAFGPYLCLAALILIVRWQPLWQWAGPIFELGWLVPGIVGCALVFLGLMLYGWQLVKMRLLGSN